jgi:hypothetical protein
MMSIHDVLMGFETEKTRHTGTHCDVSPVLTRKTLRRFFKKRISERELYILLYSIT